jgi:membrane protein insertase Oxa1/YidC/SpoIIIJ
MSIKKAICELSIIPATYYVIAGFLLAMAIISCIIGNWLTAISDVLYIIVMVITARLYKRHVAVMKIVVIQDRMIDMLSEKIKNEENKQTEEKKED